MDTPKLQLIDKAQTERMLEDPKVRRFYYRFNKPASTLLLVVSGILLASAATTWWYTGLITFWWFGLCALLVLASLGVLGFIYKWAKFTDEHFLALSSTHLYIGDEGSAWKIDWSLLDARALGFEQMDTTRFNGLMAVDVAGQNIPMRLYHPLTYIEDLQGFMVEVLTHLQALQIESGEVDDEAHDEDERGVDVDVEETQPSPAEEPVDA